MKETIWIMQIDFLPSRVFTFYQRVLFCPRPSLQLLFSGNGVPNILEAFKIHQFAYMVFFREPFKNPIAMLVHSPFQAVGDTDVHNLVIISGQDIHVEMIVSCYESMHLSVKSIECFLVAKIRPPQIRRGQEAIKFRHWYRGCFQLRFQKKALRDSAPLHQRKLLPPQLLLPFQLLPRPRCGCLRPRA